MTARSDALEAPLPDSDWDKCDTSVVSETVGYLIRRVQARTFAAFHQRFSQEGLVPAAYATLAVIGQNPGVRQGRVAEALGLQASNMVNLVKDLVARGLVVRAPSSADSRVFTLSLSAVGTTFVDEMNQRAFALDAEHTRMLSSRERATLMTLLTKMVEDPHTPARGSHDAVA